MSKLATMYRFIPFFHDSPDGPRECTAGPLGEEPFKVRKPADYFVARATVARIECNRLRNLPKG